jgi:DNA polymerase elongation subunit (family B)
LSLQLKVIAGVSAAILKTPRKEIEAMVVREKSNFRRAPLNDIAMVGTVRDAEYKVETPLVRAVRYAKEQGEKVKPGDSIRWLWVKGPQNVVGWKERVPEDMVVDYERMEELQINGLVKDLFKILYPGGERTMQKTLF